MTFDWEDSDDGKVVRRDGRNVYMADSNYVNTLERKVTAMNDLAPVLQQDIDQRVNTAARHAIAQDLARLHRQKPQILRNYAAIFEAELGQAIVSTRAETLTQLAKYSFPRPHGKACLDCGRRPVFVAMGHTSTDFCQACLERIEESQNRRNYR